VMDAARIHYAKTSDGLNIAYCASGNGPPLVMLPPMPFNHCQLSLEFSEMQSWLERISRRLMIVHFDTRGSGLSDRDISGLSADSLFMDLEAVVDRLGFDNFAILSAPTSGWLAVMYAGRRPERVSKLVLWCTFTTLFPFVGTPMGIALESLRDHDWPSYTEMLAHFAFRFEWGEPAHRWAKYLRAATTPNAVAAYNNLFSSIDLPSLLPAVQCPALVLNRRDVGWPTIDDARTLAAGIKNAQMTLLPGNTVAPYLGDTKSVIEAIEQFLGATPDGSPNAEPSPSIPSGTAVILFADIADSTALTERLGDAAFRAKARDLDAALRTVIRDHAGTPIEGKLLGDGVLAVFTSARQAIEAALACGRAGSEGGLPLHLGLHAGDVIREDNNVYGGAVNIASRISGLSAPGEVLVSDIVRGLARTSAGVRFEDRGEQSLKGVVEPVRVWAVVANQQSDKPANEDRA